MVAITAAAISSTCVLGAQSAHAASGDRIGDAVVITNVVMANFEEKQRKLSAGDDVRQDETIEVERDAQGQLKLEDDTKLALGPGSRLVLDKFVYDGEKKSGSIILNLAKGAFRFITGVAAKPTYVINTPNASITVRGTIFDVYILSDNSVWLLLQEGALEATGTNNVCRVLDRPGQLIHIASDGTVSGPVNWPLLPGNTAVGFDTAFPFVTNVPQIDTTQILTREEIVAGAFPIGPDKPCINPHTPIEIRTPPTFRKTEVPPPPPPLPHGGAPAVIEDVYVEQGFGYHHHWRRHGYEKPWKHIDEPWKHGDKPWKHVDKAWKHVDKPWKHHDDYPRQRGVGIGIIMGGMGKMGGHHHHEGGYDKPGKWRY
jgi:hypothetical protein